MKRNCPLIVQEQERLPPLHNAPQKRRQPTKSKPMFAGLLMEIWIHILSFVDVRSVLTFARCCKTCRSLAFQKQNWDLHGMKINGAILFSLVHSCTELKSLNIKGCAVSAASLRFLIKQCTKLDDLQFDKEADWDIPWPRELAIEAK